MYLLNTVWVGIDMRTVCTSGIKNSASQTCTQYPPAEQLIFSSLSLFEGNKKCSACTICYLSSYRTYISYKNYALCIMHYACCAVSAVLSNSPVLCSPARSFCVCLRLKNPIREQIHHPFRFWPEIFVFCEVARLGGGGGEGGWGSSGWCSADGGSGCSAVAGVKWEVVGGWVL